jgi:Mn-dependent DtxR family transcriptional regulator
MAAKVNESCETYLETILVLCRKLGAVHAIDIAHELGFSKPSVSIALKKLSGEGFIEVDSDRHITLTESGRKIAESMYERHLLISDWLISLGVDAQVAAADACRMEHVLSAESFAAIKRHIGE